jgi:hypothetical protein
MADQLMSSPLGHLAGPVVCVYAAVATAARQQPAPVQGLGVVAQPAVLHSAHGSVAVCARGGLASHLPGIGPA